MNETKKDPWVVVPCPLCACTEFRLFVEAPSHDGCEKLSVTKCVKCGMIFTNPQQVTYTDDVEQRGVFDRHLDAEVIASGCRQAQVQLRLLARFVSGRKVFDFGCGAGMFVHEAIREGWDAVGHDLNAGLVDAANRYWQFSSIHSGPLDRFFETHPGPYDAILSNQVFEHLQNPIEMGRILLRHLKIGGVLYVDVPNVNQPREWLHRGETLDPTAHWCHFSARTLSILFERLGCEVVFRSAAPGFVEVWNKLGLRGATTGLGVFCKQVLPPIGTGVCVIGRKTGAD